MKTQDPALVSWQGKMPFLSIFGLSLAGGMKLLVDPRQISRIYGLENEKALGVARIWSPLLMLVTYACLLPIGVFAHALVPAEAIQDSDHVMPYLLGTAEVLGPVLSSFFLLVLLSAAMSSLDSVLLVAGSSVGRDLLIVDEESDAKTLTRTRFWVVVLSLVSMLFALNPFGDIVSITAFSGSLAACFLPSLIVGLFWSRGTKMGSLVSVVLGAITVVGGHYANRTGWWDLHEVYVGTALALVVYVGVSLATRPTRNRAVEAYEKE